MLLPLHLIEEAAPGGRARGQISGSVTPSVRNFLAAGAAPDISQALTEAAIGLLQQNRNNDRPIRQAAINAQIKKAIEVEREKRDDEEEDKEDQNKVRKGRK